MQDNKEIQLWAEKAANTYNGIGMNYYSQSPLINLRPKPIMICGINPGSDGIFEEHNADFLISGNPCWKDHHKWRYWKNLKQYFAYNSDLLEDGNYVLTNMSFCATKKANEINEATLKASLPTTIELIKAIQPRRIIMLSGKKSFALLQSTSDIISNVDFVNEDLLLGRICNIPAIGVAHPSARFKSGGREKIARAMNVFIQEDYSVQAIREAYGKCRIPFSAKDVVSILHDQHDLVPYEITKDLKTYRFYIGKGLQLTITNTQHGYCGIRLKDPIRLSNGKTSFLSEEKTKSIGQPQGWTSNESWMATKCFAQFLNVEECVQEILLMSRY